MSNQKLSVVIITKNEEGKIARCLESVKWADEVIVIDDLSQDRTVEICQEFGARVISHKSEGDFDRQRNIGIDNASGNWILQMDADEIVPEGLKEEIQKVIESQGSRFIAYKIKRQNFFLGHFMRHGGWFIHYIKLFKKGKARYVGRSVHETLKVDGPVGTIDEPIKHFPFNSIEQFIERQNFYTSVEARLMYEDKGEMSARKVKYNLTIRPLKLFWKVYIKKRGFLDGMHGFLFAILNSWVYFLRWVRYWEICNLKSRGSS